MRFAGGCPGPAGVAERSQVMYLMKRQKQYLHLLMDREGPVTSREMALETGVSLRTVKTDMAKLNELLKDYDVHIMSKPGAGYRLVPNDGGGLKPLSLLMEQMQYERFDRIPDTGPERVEYIARKLLALDYYNNHGRAEADSLCKPFHPEPGHETGPQAAGALWA